MSKNVTVSKLESLLARIRGRAAEPRKPSASPAAPAAPAPAVQRHPSPVAPPVAPVAPIAAREATRVVPPPSAPVHIDEATLPPPPMSTDGDFAVDVDMQAITPPPPPPVPQRPEAVDPASARAALQSRERLSAVSSPSSEPPPPISADAAEAVPSIETGHALADAETLAAEAEEAPASSRRPVAPPPEERLAELAFGAEEPQPPRHTPPPKSGRLPAPPSTEFDAADVTGVHDAPIVGSADDDASEPAVPVARASGLVAQATRPDLVSSAKAPVADVLGDAQKFAPSTFMALLDASLSL